MSVLHLALKFIHTSIELALVADHKHHFPLEYVTVSQAAGDAWDIFVGLHLFELTGQQPGSWTCRHDAAARVTAIVRESDGVEG
jgi:hypothetical protein